MVLRPLIAPPVSAHPINIKAQTQEFNFRSLLHRPPADLNVAASEARIRISKVNLHAFGLPHISLASEVC